MKCGIFGCILCLLLIATASAATINPGLARQQTLQTAAVVSVPILQTAAITFDSSVHGATVYLDGTLLGTDEAHSKTPVTDNEVTAGNHSATFKLAGYKDMIMNFHVDAGRSQTMYAQLQPSVNIVARQQTVATVATLQVQRITPPLPVVFSTTATPATASSPVSTPTPAATPGNTLGARVVPITTILQPVEGARSVNGAEGLVPAVLTGEVPEAPPALTHIAVIDGFLNSIFGGVFGKNPGKPPLTVTMVAPTINPGTIQFFYTVAPTISRGATVYIGEQGLDVSGALATVNAVSVPVLSPTGTRIGWWASSSGIMTTSPSKTIDLAGRETSLLVSPSDFVGYAGEWYLLNSSTGHAADNGAGYPSAVFKIVDPALGLTVKNAVSGTDVSGTTITRGDQLSFTITKNIGVDTLRSPLAHSKDDGFLDIVVKTPSGKTLTELDVTHDANSLTTEPLLKSCWDQNGPTCIPKYYWDTGAVYSNATPKYESGTYTVWVVSKLNNMNNNYKNGGQPYTGKTVSQDVTFTIS